MSSPRTSENMNDDTLDILAVKDPKLVGQFALNQADYKGRLNELRKAEIDRFTLGTLIDVANNFTEIRMFGMEDAFRSGFAERQNLMAEHDDIARRMYNRRPFDRLRVHSDAEFIHFAQGYQHALQALSYLSEYAKKVTMRLAVALGGEEKLSEEAKQELVTLARDLARIAGKLQGFVKPYEK